jgi:hypothetical protein
VTTVAESRLSIVSPYLRCSQPMPPPSVSPATPVCVTIPPVVARPNAWVAWSSSPHSTPPSTFALRASGSTRMPFISPRSITIPPSQTDSPGKLWPPPRTATGSPLRRANATAATTSSNFAQRAIRAGERSIEPFHTFRSSS